MPLAMLFAAYAVTVMAGLGYLAWRDALPLLERLLVVHERRYAVQPTTNAVSEPMPADLIAAARAHAGEWAQDDVMASMRESFAELGDWTMVRARFSDVLN